MWFGSRYVLLVHLVHVYLGTVLCCLVPGIGPSTGLVWYSMVRCGTVWYGVVWCGTVWYGVVRCGTVWYGVVWSGVVWYSVAGQVDVAHNGRDQGQTTKRGRDATFGQTVKFSNYCFPTIFDFSVWENIIFSFYYFCLCENCPGRKYFNEKM